jgi:hypothetical protein
LTRRAVYCISQHINHVVEAAMTPLPLLHEETLAHALARGLSRNAARAEAGYARHSRRGRERAARADIAARARELGEARQWGETREASEMIVALMRLAGKAGEMPTAAAMVAARGLVAEAAKLNARIDERRERPDEAPAIDARFLPLSDEDWTAKYGRRE